jgi:hypothetical protein
VRIPRLKHPLSVALAGVALFVAAIGAQSPAIVGDVAGAPPLQVTAPQAAGDISPQALAQIDALLQEKASWSPAEQKIDSQLLFAAKTALGQPMRAGVPALQNNVPAEPDGRVVIDVRAEVSDALLGQFRAIGAEVVSSYPAYRDVRLLVTMNQVEAVAALPQVIFVQPKQEALTQRQRLATSVRHAVQGRSGVLTNAGAKTSEGDATHRAVEFRAAFPSADGTGVKIGVLSDGVVGLAASAATGDLFPLCTGAPAPTCVTVLSGQAGPTTTGSAEGTAMLEIIHDLAPGAQLYFATALNGISSFAQNIRDLRTAGCDIIVDDVGYFVETPFQDGQDPAIISTTNGGVVIQAVKDVVALGALYFSSAANSGNLNDGTSGTWEGDFADGGLTFAPLTEGGRLHSFAARSYDVLNAVGSANNLYWSDPLGASANDYDLFRLDGTGTIVLAASINVQNGTQDPYEQISGGSPGDRLVIVKYSGSGRFLHLSTLRGRLSIATSGETHGHAATSASNSFGVAATPALAPGPNPNPFNSSDVLETFSSDGPRRILFTSTGSAITAGNVSSTGGQVLNKPDFAAADRVAITGSGGFGGGTLFTGTSAAAPHAAAIAALLKSSGLTADQVKTALVNSAIDIEAPGLDRDSGVGVIMALTTAATGTAAPTIIAAPQDRSLTTGQTASINVVVTGTPPFSYQWYEGLQGTTTTPVGTNAPSFTTPPLAVTTRYWVRVTNAFGSADSTAATETIATATSPAIISQPRSFGVLSGQSASLGVAATGSALSYQWYEGAAGTTTTPVGTNAPGFTTPSLLVATSYWVRVSNTSGTADSVTATISVGTGPSIGTQPPSSTVSCGQPVTLSVGASGSPLLSFQWFSGASGNRSAPINGATSSVYVTPALGATASFWVRVSNPFDAASSATATVTVTPSPNCVQATYDATLKAPKCAVAGIVCDAGNLLLGRDTMSGGAEPNQPNTILNSCPDGTQGVFHTDESNDGLRVSTVDGTALSPGKTARIEATVWAFSPGSDFLDLYSAPDATNPVWTLVATLTPPTTGTQTLSATYVLPAGNLQAVRAAFRFGGSVSACTAGTDTFDDRDDLIFAVTPVAGTEFVQNGDFSSGTTNWLQWEAPDIVSSVVSGVFQFFLANPQTTVSKQATIFQNTGQPVVAGGPLLATFQLGNSSTVRKRISVLVLESDFSDLSVCTFWLPPGQTTLKSYTMRTHTTKGWANAAIYFYAATAGSNGGNYLVDNVSLKYAPAQLNDRTECVDPNAPATSAGAASANLLVNGDFASGALLPGWSAVAPITTQFTGGVLEFLRPNNVTPAGVVMQATGQAVVANQLVTATFQLGNSSSVRKRVTVLLHDLDLATNPDLTACTFWLPPGLALSNYTMRGYATQSWTNATISFYPATVGLEQWIRLDNVTFGKTAPTPGVVGTECIEPATITFSEAFPGGGSTGSGTRGPQVPRTGPAPSPLPPSLTPVAPGWLGTGGFAPAPDASSTGGAPGWRVEAGTSGRSVLQWAAPVDLTDVLHARLRFASALMSRASSAEVQVSADGRNWQTLATVPRGDEWTTVDVDLSGLADQIFYVRFVFDAIAPGIGVMPDVWMIDDVVVFTRRMKSGRP